MDRKMAIANLLLPAGWIFGTVARLRRLLYEKSILKSHEPPVATVTVGNIAVGGTGKTPHSIYIINLLKEHFNVAFLSRGYGRTSTGYKSASILKKEDVSPETLGDEPFMIHLRFPEIPLAVDTDRIEGICNIKKERPDTDVVVLDDAYQHLRLKPGFSIVLTEYASPYCDDFPMPAGRLREFPSAAAGADMVVVTKTPENTVPDKQAWCKKLGIDEKQHLFFTRMEYENPQPATPPARNIDINTLQSIVLLTGIAHPEPLKEHLSKHFAVERHFHFPDHHRFTGKDMRKVAEHVESGSSAKAVITTEKDWARMQSADVINIVSLLPVFVVRIETSFISDEESEKFNNILKEYVRRKKEET